MAIHPTYYRSLLTFEEQAIYKTIVKELLAFKLDIEIPISSKNEDSIRRIVNAVHYDHVEIFYIDFWSYYIRPSVLPKCTLHFKLLLNEKETCRSIATTLDARVKSLKEQIERDAPIKEKFVKVIKHISSEVSYRDRNSGFWDHTVVGPVLTNAAVCEGFAKLFLFYCQRLELPCAIVCGTLDGAPHAWNKVELENGIRYIDVTNLLRSHFFIENCAFHSSFALKLLGYEWEE